MKGQHSQTHLKKQSQTGGLSKMYLKLASHQVPLDSPNFKCVWLNLW